MHGERGEPPVQITAAVLPPYKSLRLSARRRKRRCALQEGSRTRNRRYARPYKALPPLDTYHDTAAPPYKSLQRAHKKSFTAAPPYKSPRLSVWQVLSCVFDDLKSTVMGAIRQKTTIDPMSTIAGAPIPPITCGMARMSCGGSSCWVSFAGTGSLLVSCGRPRA